MPTYFYKYLRATEGKPITTQLLDAVMSPVYSTGTIAPSAVETGTWLFHKSFLVIQMQVSSVCRVRLYTSPAAAAADVNRPSGTPPTPGTQHGVILDIVFNDPASLTWTLAPPAIGADATGDGGDIAYNVTNLDVAPAIIQVTTTHVILTAGD